MKEFLFCTILLLLCAGVMAANAKGFAMVNWARALSKTKALTEL